MEDAAEHVLQFGTELEDSEQYRFHYNKGKEWGKKGISIQSKQKETRKKEKEHQIGRTDRNHKHNKYRRRVEVPGNKSRRKAKRAGNTY